MVPPLKAAFRSPVKYGVAWVSELAGPLLAWWARRKAPRPVSRPETWRKGLLLGANHIGDILYRSGSLQSLADAFPQCEWHIMAPPPACEVLEGHPAIAKIHRFEPPASREDTAFKKLQEEAYDVVVLYDVGMYFQPLKLALELGIPNRVGYVHKGFSRWVTWPVSINWPQAYPNYFRDLVAELTGGKAGVKAGPVVFPSAADEAEAVALVEKIGGEKTGIVATFITSRQPFGVFPAAKLAEALREVEKQMPALVTVLCGAPGDVDLLKAMKEQFSLRAEIVAGGYSLRALVAFLRRCRVVLSTDSGPRHLANAAGVPVVFVRNTRFDAVEAGAYSRGDHDLCPPDVSFADEEEQAAAFASISPLQIADTVLGLLKR